jgi:hypothetical protein
VKDWELLWIKVFFLHPGAGTALPANPAPRPYFAAPQLQLPPVSASPDRLQLRLAETADRLLVALGAFAVGMAAGVLFAPREGASTRRILSDSARTAASGAGARVAAATEPVADALRERAGALAERHLPLAGEWEVVDGPALVRDLREGRP